MQRADSGGSDLSGMTFHSFMSIDIGASILTDANFVDWEIEQSCFH